MLILHSRQQSPGEIKRREVSRTQEVSLELEEIKSREVELGLRVGLLLQLFPNS